jgi:ComF family protein
VHQFKYRNLRALAPLFAISLYDCLKNKPFDIDVIVPVPLHSRRLRERGYNQSALLAHELSRLLDIPCVENRLVRRIATPSLVSSASREARLALVSQAFETRGGDFAGKHVLLVDDVSTSGATFNACARVLREAGAVKIHGIALALEL